MKILPVLVVICCTLNVCEAQSLAGQSSRPQLPDPTPYVIAQQDANSRVWERTVYELDTSGRPVPKIRQVTELATGLNHLVNGRWVESSEAIDILPNGTAAGLSCQHQAYFPGDIYDGQIKLVTPEGMELYSRPLCLCYFVVVKQL